MIAHVGNILDDAEDFASSAVDRVRDVGSSVVDNIPGGSQLAGALRDLANGPLRDFANTAVGRIVMQAVASTFYGSIAWTLGPQLASIAFAVPGLAAGDDLTTAYLQGLKTRAEQTAQIVGVPWIANAFGDDVTRALKKLATELAPYEKIVESGEELAKRFGIRVDAADFVRAIWNRLPLPSLDRYGLDGSRLPAGARMVVNVNRRNLAQLAYQPPPKYATTSSAAIAQASTVSRLIFGDTPPSSAPPLERATSSPDVAPHSPALVALGIVGAVVGVGALAWFAANKR